MEIPDPILLCNELGAPPLPPPPSTSPSSPNPGHHAPILSSGRTTISVKEAVQIARDNNFMGLICSSRLLDLAPALIESIKTAGLVLIMDVSDAIARNDGTEVQRGGDDVVAGGQRNVGRSAGTGEVGRGNGVGSAFGVALGRAPVAQSPPVAGPRGETWGHKGVDGVLKANGVLRFNESVDM